MSDARAKGCTDTRASSRIFDPAFRESIGELIDDVRAHGDAAVSRALKRFDGCDVDPTALRVEQAGVRRGRAVVAAALGAAIRDAIDHVRRFNEQLTAERDWSIESEPGAHSGREA